MSLLYIELIFFFFIGYVAIIFEKLLNLNKAATALLMAVGCWAIYFYFSGSKDVEVLGEYLSEVAQIIFFLLAAMTIVELIDSHHGFKLITDYLHTTSKRKMLWSILLISFFLSSVLDNLTTMILTVSLLKKMIPERHERWLLGSLVVISVNAGGAWTPIGDVTTTMMWIKGTITSFETMKWLFLPSFACLVVSGLLAMPYFKGNYSQIKQETLPKKMEPGARFVLFGGILALILVPVWKGFFHIPPFLGALLGLGALWLITDLIHFKHEKRGHLRVPYVLAKIDTSGILFFLGILLAISSLTAAGILKDFATVLERVLPNQHFVAIVIGIISSIVDNVPLVAATFGMYDVATYPVDSMLWQLIAYAAGTGGSILIIGSAAGVAFMGLEGIDFIWYFKRVSWIALIGYFAGLGVYYLQRVIL